ncbi:hypothetical protein N658DRAFT_554778 [Parathielavia hyrcaniae]|uniref:Uncharacterized protein n=1 Tax=Parathielavia hyrcaniae TaxID=113614 RepID=A0AAN6PRB6_9PEZI|nr:hypothetical protein N658DRAFT_554778 [Parathielavia hyrcaniae]
MAGVHRALQMRDRGIRPLGGPSGPGWPADTADRTCIVQYAHVCIAPSDLGVPADLHCSQTAPYPEVRGVLLEVVDGYRLWDITTSQAAPADPKQWPATIQSAADAAHTINKHSPCQIKHLGLPLACNYMPSHHGAGLRPAMPPRQVRRRREA